MFANIIILFLFCFVLFSFEQILNTRKYVKIINSENQKPKTNKTAEQAGSAHDIAMVSN